MLGIEGLALLRAGVERRGDAARERVAEMREILDRLAEPPYAVPRDLPARDVASGYAQWAGSYDDPGNDTIAMEEPVVRGLLDELPPGAVLDAACGTGRHAVHLRARGREVVGVDASVGMLARAAAKVPGADLRQGNLNELPLADEEVSAAVCALALSHLPTIGAAVAELARVISPGGRLVISDPHPFAVGVLGWRALYVDSSGRRVTIPEHARSHADYVGAFAAAGLTVRRLFEPPLTREAARARAKPGHEDAFEEALTGLPAVIVWELVRDGTRQLGR